MQLTPDLVREALSLAGGPLDPMPIPTTRARPAAVAVPVVFAPEPRVLLVLRSADLADHAGEVGFPGGKPEPGDADLRDTARRELEEEVAVGERDVAWLGSLRACPVITGRYLIHPFVAAIDARAAPRVASTEIARLLELPLVPLITGAAPIFAVEGEWQGTMLRAPHIRLDGCTLYGASAYILYELLSKIAAHQGRAMPPLIIEHTPPWGDRYARS